VAVSVVDIQVNSQGAVRSLQHLNAAVKGVTATIGSLAAALGAGFALQQVIRTASEFESTLSDIGKTAGSSQKDILKLADSLKQLSMPGRTNLAPSVLAKGVQDLVAQGLKLDDAVASIETLGKVAVATNSDLTDVTKTGFQLQSALKIKPTELKETFDALAFAGKAGAFELKDMAQFMPTIASAATSIGITGKKGAVALAAMMQMVRKDAPGAAEASTRLTDALLKMTAPDAVKKFAKFGVNIEQVLKGAVAKGINPMDAALKELQRVTGGDAFKLSQIFGDKEAKLALMSLMKYREEYEKLKALAGGAAAAGTIQADFEASLKTFNQQLQSLTNASEILALGLGSTLLPILAQLIEEILPIVNGVAEFVKGIGQVPKPVIDAAIQIGKLVIQLTLVDKAIKIAMATAALFRGAMLLLATQTTLTGAAALTGQARLLMLASGITGAGSAAAVATPLIGAMALMLGRLAALGIVTVGINYVSNVVGEAMSLRQLQERRVKGGAAASFKGATRETVVAAQAAQRKNLAALDKKEEARKKKLEKDYKNLYSKPIVGTLAFTAMSPFIAAEENKLREQAIFSKAVIGLDPNKFKPAAATPPTPTPPPTPAPTPTGGTKPGKNTAADEALRLKNSLGDLGIELNLKRQIFGIDEKIFQAGLVKDNATVIRLEGEKRLAEINAEILKLENQKLTPLEKQAKAQLLIDDRTNAQKLTQQQLIANQVQVAQQAEAAIRPLIQEGELMQAKLNGTEEEYQKRLLIQQIMRDNPTLQMRDVEAIVTKNQALQRQLTQAEQLKAVYSDIGMTIKSGVVDAIQGAVNGTKSLGEVAANVLSNIANKLLDIAVNMALFGAMSGTGSGGGLFGGLFGGGKGGGGLGSVASNMNQYAPLPGFAAGGTPPVGRPSLVGERGPELFMPGVRGSIIPNDAMGGGSTSVVVNVDASGSSVQGDQAQGRQLGVAISAAVQAELVKQQRPGGLLANTRR
jgi:TP901 family phage tail tape measure protein